MTKIASVMMRELTVERMGKDSVSMNCRSMEFGADRGNENIRKAPFIFLLYSSMS